MNFSMELLSFATVGLVFVATILVAGNNLSACVGPAVGSRIITKRLGIILGSAGFTAGLLLQGPIMQQSVSILLPHTTVFLRTEALMIAIVVFTVAFMLRVPMSLNMSLVGMLVGLNFASNSSTNSNYVGEVVLTWVAVPLLTFGLAFCFLRILNKGWPKNFWRRLQTYKILLIVLSFSTAYVTGANTVGMIVATGGFGVVSILAAIAAIFVGCFFLSGGAIRRISQEFFLMRYSNATVTLLISSILLEIATVLNIPLSITQSTSSAVFGTGLSYGTKFVSAKPFLKIAAGWVVAPLLSFTIGYLVG